MKRLFLLLGLFFINIGSAWSEEATLADKQGAMIYEKCASQLPEVKARQPILGNVEDIKRERNLRNCLKEEIIKITSKSLSEKELRNFKIALSDAEQSLFSVYKYLIFCQNIEDGNWCQERYKDDMSLEKLMLEKELTSQMKNILTSALEHNQGS